METKHVVEKGGSGFFGCWEFGKWDEMGKFGQSVGDDVDARVAVGWREVGDKIHGDLGPRLYGRLERVEKAVWSVSGHLSTVTRGTLLNVHRGVLGKRGPPELTLKKLDGTARARVSSSEGVVVVP